MTKWLITAKETGHPLVVTQNGKSAAVVLSPQEFDKLNYTKEFIDSVNQGMRDVEWGTHLQQINLKMK